MRVPPSRRYNWSPSLVDALGASVARLLTWVRLRSHMLSCALLHKAGMPHAVSNSCTTVPAPETWATAFSRPRSRARDTVEAALAASAKAFVDGAVAGGEHATATTATAATPRAARGDNAGVDGSAAAAARAGTKSSGASKGSNMTLSMDNINLLISHAVPPKSGSRGSSSASRSSSSRRSRRDRAPHGLASPARQSGPPTGAGRGRGSVADAMAYRRMRARGTLPSMRAPAQSPPATTPSTAAAAASDAQPPTGADGTGGGGGSSASGAAAPLHPGGRAAGGASEGAGAVASGDDDGNGDENTTRASRAARAPDPVSRHERVPPPPPQTDARFLCWESQESELRDPAALFGVSKLGAALYAALLVGARTDAASGMVSRAAGAPVCRWLLTC